MPDPEKKAKPPFRTEDWRELAKKASREPDPRKLLRLVEDLCDRLDQGDTKLKVTSKGTPYPRS